MRVLRTTLPPRLQHAIGQMVPAAVRDFVVDRAITLSRDKYCSVWHSMRQDIEFHVTFDAVA